VRRPFSRPAGVDQFLPPAIGLQVTAIINDLLENRR
jgi:hypothetical protein